MKLVVTHWLRNYIKMLTESFLEIYDSTVYIYLSINLWIYMLDSDVRWGRRSAMVAPVCDALHWSIWVCNANTREGVVISFKLPRNCISISACNGRCQLNRHSFFITSLYTIIFYQQIRQNANQNIGSWINYRVKIILRDLYINRKFFGNCFRIH